MSHIKHVKLHTVHYRLTQSLSTKIERGIFFSCDLSAQGLNKIFLALQKSRQNLPCFFLREGWQKLGSTKHNRPNVFAYNPVSSMGHKITAWSVKINSFLFWFLEPISVINTTRNYGEQCEDHVYNGSLEGWKSLL